MGKGFGELAKIHGLITYKISPFEQRAFAGALKKVKLYYMNMTLVSSS